MSEENKANEAEKNTEKTAASTTEAGETKPREIDLLKARADQLGIPYKGNIGADALKKKIEAKLNDEDDSDDDDDQDDGAAKGKTGETSRKKSRAEIEAEIRANLQKEKMKLIRCRIYNLDPTKNELHGDFITVANRYLGTVRKYIPYGEQTDGGYHIPKVLFDELKRRRFQQVRTKTVKGQIKVETRMVPEFSIEVLEPLTPEELNELALNQQAAARVGIQD